MSPVSTGPAVYFVSPENGGPIRIGCCSIPVGARIASLNTLYPERLALLGIIPGYAIREALLLMRFRRYRVRGDWFRPSLKLWKLIGEAAETGDLAELPLEPEASMGREEVLSGLADLGHGIDDVVRMLALRAKPGCAPASWRDSRGASVNLQALHLGLVSGWLSCERDLVRTTEAAPC